MNASWISSHEFADLKPIDIFGKELAPKNKPDTEHVNKHILYRKNLTLTAGKAYTMRITADDYYKLYINGHFVCMGPAPSYHFAYNYNTVDVSKYIVQGENQILVHTYYQGLYNRVFVSGDLRQGMWCELLCQDETVCVSDETWEYAYDYHYGDGLTVGYKTQFLENINTYNMQLDWQKATLKKYVDYTLRPQITKTCLVEEIKPVSITSSGDNSWLLDFGKEYAGCIRIAPTIPGVVTLAYGEEALDGHAMSHMRAISNCEHPYVETWTLNGIDAAEGYDYKAFRVLEITGPIPPESVTMIKRSYPIKNAASFKTNNETLNQILEICRQGVLTGTQEVFMDCPTREKGQYLGDLTVTAQSHAYITGDAAMYKKALLDFADSTFICKGLMCCAPCAYAQEIADFTLLYPYQVYKYYKITGDLETVQKLYPTVQGMIDYFALYRREDGLLENVTEKWNLIDWPSNLRDDYDFEATKPIGPGVHNVLNSYYYGALLYAQKLAEIVGDTTDYQADIVRDAFYKAFFRPELGLFADSEVSMHTSLHSNALPMFFNMVEKPEPVVKLILEKGLCCGVFTAYFVLKGLIHNGYRQEAFDLMLNDSIHSWVNMLREDATTCFEAWGKDQKWNTSLCHPWASAPIIIVKEDFPELLI
ncbi:MAG: alpha-L-rhamnosidase [Firmicutes bacterium]|nr:alpha-L-rhamnosidase [Bacillota bacterium]